MAMSREERLLATQQAYEAWSEETEFITEDGASDADESKLLDTMLDQGLINPD